MSTIKFCNPYGYWKSEETPINEHFCHAANGIKEKKQCRLVSHYLLRKGLLDSAPNRKNEATQNIYFLYSSAYCAVVGKLTFGAMHTLQEKITVRCGKSCWISKLVKLYVTFSVWSCYGPSLINGIILFLSINDFTWETLT